MNLEEYCDYCPYRRLKLFRPAVHTVFCTRNIKYDMPFDDNVYKICELSMPDLFMLLADPDRWIIM